MSNYANRMEYRSLHMNMLTNALFCHEYKPGERCSLGFCISCDERCIFHGYFQEIVQLFAPGRIHLDMGYTIVLIAAHSLP